MFINIYSNKNGSTYTLEQTDHSIDGALNSLMENGQFWSEYQFTLEIFGSASRRHNLAATLGECWREQIGCDPGLADVLDEPLWLLDSAAARAANMVTQGAA